MKFKIGVLIGVLLVAIALAFFANSTREKETAKALKQLNEDLGNAPYELSESANTTALDTAIIAEAREKLKELDLYKAFFEDNPVGLLVKKKFPDCNCFRVVKFNKAWEKIVLEPSGIDSASYVYSSDFDLWPDSLATLYDAQDNYAVDNKIVSEFTAPFYHNGKIKQADFVKYSDNKERLYLIILTTKTWEELPVKE